MIDRIFEMAGFVFDVPRQDLAGPSRAQHLVAARQAVMLALRRRTRLSLCEIGRLLGNRDHSTVASGIAAAGRRCAADPAYRRAVAALCDADAETPAAPAPRADAGLRWALMSAGGIVTALAA